MRTHFAAVGSRCVGLALSALSRKLNACVVHATSLDGSTLNDLGKALGYFLLWKVSAESFWGECILMHYVLKVSKLKFQCSIIIRKLKSVFHLPSWDLNENIKGSSFNLAFRWIWSSKLNRTKLRQSLPYWTCHLSWEWNGIGLDLKVTCKF